MKATIDNQLKNIEGHIAAIRVDVPRLTKMSIKGAEAIMLLRDAQRNLNAAMEAVRLAANQELVEGK